MRVLSMVFFVLMVSVFSASAATFYVDQSGTSPYLTIASAMTASAAGDTVLVGPGTYNEGISLNTTRRTVIGAGWDVTHITSIAGTNANAAGSVIEGFHSVAAYPVNMSTSADSVLVRRCRLEGTVYAALLNGTRLVLEDCLLLYSGTGSIVSVSTGRIVIRNCVFYHANGNSVARYAIAGANGNLEVYNCVFLDLLRILNCTGSQPVVFINNLVYDWAGASPSYGTYLAGSVFAYNASDVITPPGTNAILLTANPFVSYDPAVNWTDNSNLHLVAGTPCIDAGHPDIIDLDNSPSDLGIYGGPRPLVANGVPSYPFPLTLTISPTLIGVGDTVQVNTSGRVGPRY